MTQSDTTWASLRATLGPEDMALCLVFHTGKRAQLPCKLMHAHDISFGFTYLDTTLLICIDGLIDVVTIRTSMTLATRIPNSRAYVLRDIFSSELFMIEFLHWREHVALLFGIQLIACAVDKRHGGTHQEGSSHPTGLDP